MKYNISNIIFALLALPLHLAKASPLPGSTSSNIAADAAIDQESHLSGRADPTIFDPGNENLPSVQDVLDFTKDIKPADDERPEWYVFKRAFAVTFYAMAQGNHGKQVLGALLKNAKDQPGSCEVSWYEPMEHEKRFRVIGFNEVHDMKGGTDLEDFKHRWWIAALWTVMKAEWDTYYVKTGWDNLQLTYSPTDKGKAYDQVMETGLEGSKWQLKQWNIGDIDAKAAHWLMTVLLRRNIVISRQASNELPDGLQPKELEKITTPGPALWVGNVAGQPSDDTFKGHVGYYLQDVTPEPDYELILVRPDGGSETPPDPKPNPVTQETPQFPVIFHLYEMAETWGDDWYDRPCPPIEAMKPQT